MPWSNGQPARTSSFVRIPTGRAAHRNILETRLCNSRSDGRAWCRGRPHRSRPSSRRRMGARTAWLRYPRAKADWRRGRGGTTTPKMAAVLKVSGRRASLVFCFDASGVEQRTTGREECRSRDTGAGMVNPIDGMACRCPPWPCVGPWGHRQARAAPLEALIAQDASHPSPGPGLIPPRD